MIRRAIVGACVAGVVLLGSIVSAQDNAQPPLSLDGAITYGLEHNRSLKASMMETRAAGEQVKQARADFLPKLDGHYSFRHLNDQPYFGIVGGIGGASAGTADPDRSQSSSAGSAVTKMPSGYRDTNHWEVEVRQPLFAGFGIVSNYEASKLGETAAKYRFEQVRLNLVRDIEHAYWQVLLGQRLVEVARDNVKSLEVHRRNAEASYQQGLTAQNDVLKAEVALSQAVQTQRQTEKQLVMLQARFNQLLDLDVRAPVSLVEEEVHPAPVPSMEVLFTAAEERRPENLEIQTSIQQMDKRILAARSRYYPQVSAFANYYREGEDFTADRNIYTNNENAAIGVRLDWNLFEGGKTRAAAAELLYRKSALQEQQRELIEQIHIQVEDAYKQLQVAEANIDTAAVALKQAQENERMTSLQYQEQVVIFLEVLNAQVFVAQTQADYYQALYGYKLAQADLERAVGLRRLADAGQPKSPMEHETTKAAKDTKAKQ